MNRRRTRVAVTGVGAVTALGADIAETFRRVAAGERAFGEIDELDTSRCKIRLGAEIKGFRVSDVASVGRSSVYSRADALAVVAARQAIRQAGVEGQDLFLAVGGTGGGMREAEPVFMSPADVASAHQAQRLMAYPLFRSAQRIAEATRRVRRAATFCSACSSSATAIVQAALWVAAGRCDCALAGGTDSLSLLTLTGFAALGALSSEPCRPFDAARSGLSLGEGAAFLLLESEAHARHRDATVLAWLDGWSLGAEAHHITHPEPRGASAARLIVTALDRAGLSADAIQYYNAHGTGTIPNDAMEASALRLAFGSHTDSVFVSTVKGQLGHTLGAAGAIEAAITVSALRAGQLPPTMGLTSAGADTRLSHVIGTSIACDCRHAISSSFGFGGLGAVLAFSRADMPDRTADTKLRSMLLMSVAGTEPRADPVSALDPDRSRRFDRVTALACAGVASKTEDAGLVVASAYGNVTRLRNYLTRLGEKGVRGLAPAEFPHLVPSAIAGNASIYGELTGPVTTVCDETHGFEVGLDFACSAVEAGLAESMTAGLVEASDAGAASIADPFGVLTSMAPASADASIWLRVVPDGSGKNDELAPRARIADLRIDVGPWYQYFAETQAPETLAGVCLVLVGIDVRAFERLPGIGRWLEVERRPFTAPGLAAARSGFALAAAVALIARGEASDVVVVSRTIAGHSIVRLVRP